MSEIVFEGEKWIGTALTDAERTLLLNQMYTVLAAESGFLGRLFHDNEAKIIGAAEVAKKQLEAPFAGLFASDSEFGMQLIRPAHVIRDTTAAETPIDDWTSNLISAAGFTANSDYWIGYGTNNTTAINIDKRLLVMPMAVGFAQGGPPTVEEIMFQVGSTTYPIVVVRQAQYADNENNVRMARIRPMIWPGKSTVLAQVWSILASVQQLQLIGLSFAKGDLLRTQNITAVQT